MNQSKSILCAALLLAGLCTTFLGALNVASAQSNLVLLVSQTGDYIGGGGGYVTTNPDDFSVGGVGGYAVSVSAFGYYVLAEGVNFGALSVGAYPNASRFATENSPELDISGNGRGCNVACGSFQIYELETNSAGHPTRLWMTFTHYCECGSAALTGEVRYNSQLAPPMPTIPRILRVPQDYPAIQAGIDAANPLVQDTVLVTNGIYYEDLDFLGKPVVVSSCNGPQATLIDGNQTGTIINFGSGEGAGSQLIGFTLTNGSTAVNISYSSPTIISNVIVNCGSGIYGSGTYYSGISPVIQGNLISNCPNGALTLDCSGTSVVQGNVIQNNGQNNQPAILLAYGGAPSVNNNLIVGNYADAIMMFNGCDAGIFQNVIAHNGGNGILALVPYGDRGPFIVNNTFDGNGTSGYNGGAGINFSGFFGASAMFNNLVSGNPALILDSWDGSYPDTEFNDFYSPSANIYGISGNGAPTNFDGTCGNISADPFFACEPDADFHLLAGSPGIDAGTNGAPFLPDMDFDGNPRIVAGISNHAPTVDMGAYEFNLLNPPIPCMFVNCQTDIVVYTASGQNSAGVTFPPPTGTPFATITCSPPSGSVFYGGTNVVTCTATYGTNSASCTFNIIVVLAPAITMQPQNLQVSAGQRYTLSVGVSGTPPMFYQWSFQGQPLYGQNAATLTITNAQFASDGVYSVLVYNAAGSTNSSLARVRVLPAKPIIVEQPVSTTSQASFSASFTVAAIGSQPLAYQWYFNNHPIPGAASPQFYLNNCQAANAGNYYLMVSNWNGAVTSKVVRLKVTPMVPYFVTQPVSGAWLYDSTAMLPSLAQGSEPIHYQWYFNGRPMPGQISPVLIISKIARLSAGNYFVLATNSFGRATSVVAQVTVEVPPQLTRGLSNQIVNAGQNVTLSANASGDLPMSYFWTFNGSPITWSNAVLNLTNVQSTQAGYYVLTISNAFGLISSQAKVTILGPTGQLVAWGDNTGGQTNIPAGLSNIVAMAGGDLHTIALRANGKPVAWGGSSDGQTNIPAHLPPLVSIAAGAHHNLAIGEDGSLFAWGDNSAGQCNLPPSPNASFPFGSSDFYSYWPGRPVSQPADVSAGDAHSLALTANGTVAVWGDNSYGQISVPTVLLPEYTLGGWWGIYLYQNPYWVPASAISAGRNHNLAVLTNGVVVAWGDNSGGQCNVPGDLTNAVAVAGGYLHSVALRADGTVAAWGDNTYGQTNVPTGLTNVIAVSAGDFNSLALRANGSVVAWGDNTYGQNKIPAGVSNVVSIASGYYHSMALIRSPSTPVSVSRHPVR